MKTNAALTAQAIRQELKAKFPNTKFRVTSKKYSGGSSVDVDWVDGPSKTAVDAITEKYEYGHFDGMTDCYEYSNRRNDIPQVKFLFTRREYSEEKISPVLSKYAHIENSWQREQQVYGEIHKMDF